MKREQLAIVPVQRRKMEQPFRGITHYWSPCEPEQADAWEVVWEYEGPVLGRCPTKEDAEQFITAYLALVEQLGVKS